MTERIVTRAIIVNENGEVLLGQRARGAGEGQYALIGGKPDEDESMENAVIREVKEEIGTDFSPSKLWKEHVDTASDSEDPWTVFYYEGKISGEIELAEDEVSSVLYVSIDSLGSLDVAFNHRDILNEYFSQNYT